MNKTKRFTLGFLSILILVGIDQITKILAQTKLQYMDPISIIPNVLQLQYLRNFGAAFGMMQNATIFFIILTVVLMCLFIYCFIRIPEKSRYTPLIIVLCFFMAGAIGNLIDRILHAYVIDFIYFKLINFPIFNVADIYVSCACFVFIILLLFFYKDEELSFFKKRK